MRRKIELNNEIHLELEGGTYYKPYNQDGDEIKGILLKDCTHLYNDGKTWEFIDIDNNGCLDVGPFIWNGYDTGNIGNDNWVLNCIQKQLIKQTNK